MLENVVATAVGLIEICEDLKMPLAHNKLAVVSFDDILAAKISKRLGSQQHAQAQARKPGCWLPRRQG